MQKTKIKYYISFYIIPTSIVVLWMAYIVFVLLQLAACAASWNFASRFFDCIQITTLGKGSSGPLYLIDHALFGALVFYKKSYEESPLIGKKSKRDKLIEEKHLFLSLKKPL